MRPPSAEPHRLKQRCEISTLDIALVRRSTRSSLPSEPVYDRLPILQEVWLGAVCAGSNILMARLLTMPLESLIPMCTELCVPLVEGGGCQPALDFGLAIGVHSAKIGSCGGRMTPTPSGFVIGRFTDVVCMLIWFYPLCLLLSPAQNSVRLGSDCTPPSKKG